MRGGRPQGAVDGRQCTCRERVEQELARLRAELASEIRTRRLRVAHDHGPRVLMEAGEHLAMVRVETADGGVGAELVASTDDAEGYAAVALSFGGNVVAVLSALQPRAGVEAVTRLVFDRPGTPGSWTVLDLEGVRQEG